MKNTSPPSPILNIPSMDTLAKRSLNEETERKKQEAHMAKLRQAELDRIKKTEEAREKALQEQQRAQEEKIAHDKKTLRDTTMEKVSAIRAYINEAENVHKILESRPQTICDQTIDMNFIAILKKFTDAAIADLENDELLNLEQIKIRAQLLNAVHKILSANTNEFAEAIEELNQANQIFQDLYVSSNAPFINEILSISIAMLVGLGTLGLFSWGVIEIFGPDIGVLLACDLFGLLLSAGLAGGTNKRMNACLHHDETRYQKYKTQHSLLTNAGFFNTHLRSDFHFETEQKEEIDFTTEPAQTYQYGSTHI